MQVLGSQEAYDDAIKKIKQQEPSPNNLFDQFLTEKSLDVHKVIAPYLLILI